MSPRRLLIIASVLLVGAAIHFFFLRPTRRRGRLATVAVAQRQLTCCTRGARLELCRERLADLIELSAGQDKVAADARTLRATCPASNELDPLRPHPPEQILCGFTAAQEDREAAALALAKSGGLRQLLAGPCTEEGVLASVPALAGSFESACGDSACLDFFLSGRAPQSARGIAAGHSHKLLVALLTRLAQPGYDAQANRPALQQLLGWAADADVLAEPLAVLLLGGPGTPASFALLLRPKPSPVLLSVLKTLAESKSAAAARRAQLVQFALGEIELGPAQEAAAIDEVDCTVLPALWPGLQLDEAPRADAAARTPMRCRKDGLGLLSDPLQIALTPRVVTSSWRLLEGHTPSQLRFEPAARRLMHALLQQPKPPASGVRLSAQVFTRADELAVSLRPLLRSDQPLVRAAAAAALATTREELPREAALACAREQQAWISCALTGSSTCGDVCGGAPLSGVERLRIAEAAHAQVPDPSLAQNQR